jgi:hypothetical protein
MTIPRALVVSVVVLLVVAGATGAVSSPRDRPVETEPPVRVFVDETLDVSAVELTGGGTVGTDPVAIVGVAGEADGVIEDIDDPTDADFGGFATGSYDVRADGDDRAEFSVVEPRVTSVVVTNQNGANVTNGWEPSGASLTVTAEYNFDEADRLDLTVEAPDGLEVTSTVASRDRFTTSGGSVSLDLSDEADGTFRITVEGSDLEAASRTVTVRTGPRRTTTATATQTATPTRTATPETTPTATRTTTPTSTTEPTPTSSLTMTPTATTEPTPTEPPDTTAPATPTAPSTTTRTTTPGFGSIVALMAVAGVACLLHRRRE